MQLEAKRAAPPICLAAGWPLQNGFPHTRTRQGKGGHKVIPTSFCANPPPQAWGAPQGSEAAGDQPGEVPHLHPTQVGPRQALREHSSSPHPEEVVPVWEAYLRVIDNR